MNLSREFYAQVHEFMPILCVDIVVGLQDGVLLIQRDAEPVKGQWWFCGGRVIKGETLKTAARRIVRREAGIKINCPIQIGFDQTQFTTDPFDHGQGTHTVNFVYVARVSEMDLFNVILDDYHVAYRKFTWEEIYKNLEIHPYVKKFSGMAETILKS